MHAIELVNEAANHQNKQICFAIAADGHDGAARDVSAVAEYLVVASTTTGLDLDSSVRSEGWAPSRFTDTRSTIWRFC